MLIIFSHRLLHSATMAALFSRKGCNTQTTLYNLWKQHQKLKQPCKEYSPGPRPRQFNLVAPRPRQFNLEAPPTMAVPPALTSSGKWVSNIGVVSWYLGMVKSWPVITKGITCGIMYAASDLTSQTMKMESGESTDLGRTTRMAGIGLLMVGPSLHYWFNFAAKLFPSRNLISTLKKVCLGHILYGPSTTALFFAFNAALQDETGKEIIGRLKRDLIPAVLNGYVYWSVCDFFIYKFIPVYLQPLGSNLCVYVWCVYTTHMANLEKVIEA